MSRDWRAALFDRRTVGVRLGTASLEQVLDALLPGVREDPPFAVVQIVGTNGKGSTAAMVEHGLRALGRGPVGLFTSPHLQRIGERIRVDGRAVDDAEVRRGIERLTAAEAAAGVSLSFFEVLTAIGLSWFCAAGCREVVLEAGLGGRLDATSAVRPAAIGIARVALDHQSWLGDTLEAIAAEKAAVIRAGVPVFSVEQEPQVRAVIEARARAVGAPLRLVEPLEHPPRGLPGPHQRHNAALALALLRELAPDDRPRPELLDGVRWPGRLERIEVAGGSVWLDVAHNLDGIEALSAALETLQLDLDRGAIVFGTMADKPAAEMAERLRERGPLWLVPPTGTGTGTGAGAGTGAGEGSHDLDTVARPGERRFAGPGDPALHAAIAELLERGATVLACGSHYLVGALRAQLLAPGSAIDGPELGDPLVRTRPAPPARR